MVMLSEADILSLTYFDTCNIIRYKDVENELTGISENKETEIYSNIKCSISKSTDISTNNQADFKTSYKYFKLFCNYLYTIKSGDIIDVTYFNGRKERFKASEPFYYPSHLECLIESETLQ